MPNDQSYDPRVSTPGERVAQAVGLSVAAVASGGNGIAGTVADGQTITISSDGVNGFGSTAPTVEFFSDFSEMSAGTRLDAQTPTVGSFYGNAPNLVSSVYAHGGSNCYECVKGGSYEIARIALPNTPNTILVSYWTYVPAGKAMPAYEIDSFAIKDAISASSWKLGWLSTGDSTNQPDFGGSDGGDLCVPTNNGADSWSLAGNATGAGFYQRSGYVSPSQILTHGEWLWTSVLIDPDNQGLIKVRHLSKTKGFFEFSEAISNTFWGTAANQFWQFFNLSGYARPGDALTDAEVYHDDVLIQGGAAAGLSVVIGDAPTLSTCTDLHTNCRVTSVSDSQIGVSLGKTPFSNGYAGKYLFVLGLDGVPISYNGNESRAIS